MTYRKYGIDTEEEDNETYETAKELVKEQIAEDWSTENLLKRYENLRDITLKNMPEIWVGLEFALSIKTILNIKDCTLPFAGILLGSAGSAKTAIVQLFRGRRDTFYTDNFSPKSLVSHNSAVKKEKLKEVDMLPKLKNKFFLTPELSPIFSSREDELLQMLGILTRVLDGHGYESDTGAQGHRGYSGNLMFTWLGAAVDIPYRVHKVLGTLGPKLYFFRLPRTEEDENYYHETREEVFEQKQHEIRVALLEYLAYWEMNPAIIMEDNDDLDDDLLKVQPDVKSDVELADRIIIRLSKLLAHLRAVVPTWETKDTQGSDYAYTIAKIEVPKRAITQLRNLARGHALSQGRSYFSMEDIPIVIHTALSTATMERVRILELLIANHGSLTTSQIVDFLNTTNPTARRTMTELKATGLVDMKYDEYSQVYSIKLKPEFDWFLTSMFTELKERIWLKEKCPPRTQTPPQFLYDYHIIKKLNLCCQNSFSENGNKKMCVGGVQNSFNPP
jgi:predicted transcriptional regulator